MEDINYTEFSKNEFKKELKRLQELYTNDIPEISDEEFDYLKKYYENKFNTTFEDIGSKPRSDAVELPYYLPSLGKIKGDDSLRQLTTWLKKYPGEKVVEDKLDGFTLLYTFDKNTGEKNLYTRGDGKMGQNVSHLLPYLPLPDLNESIVVRGELILEKDVFEEYVRENRDSKNKLRKARTLVNGFATSVKSLKKDLLRKATFVAFEILDSGLTPQQQLEKLERLDFTFPTYKIIKGGKSPEKILNKLSRFLDKRRIDAPYDIDGLVIVDNNVHRQSEEDIASGLNPKYARAYKKDTLVPATVIDIEWNISSKDGYINPVIIIDPVEILGSEVSRVSGNNAKFIIGKKIGIDAKLIITLGGDIIPRVISVEEESNNLVYPDLNEDEYRWDENHVDFILINPEENPEVMKNKMIYFFTHLNVKSLGPSTIDKLFDEGFNTFEKIFNMKADDIDQIEGLGKKSALKIVMNINEAITNAKLYKIMAASTMMGEGLAENRIQEVLTTFNITTVKRLKKLSRVDEDELVEEISKIKGFAEKTSRNFATNLPRFVKWLESHKKITIEETVVKTPPKTGKYSGKVIVLSDLKNKKALKDRLEELGGTVMDNVTKKVNLLIVGSAEETSKVKLAKKYGIEILPLEKVVV